MLIAPAAAGASGAVTVVTVPRPSSRLRRMTTTMLRILRLAIRARANLYHLHDPELIPIGLLLRMSGKVVVYDAHESLPQQVFNKPWISPRLRSTVSHLARILERIAGSGLSAIVAATPHIAAGYNREKTVTVQNFPFASEFHEEIAVPYSSRPNVAAYVGGISAVRGATEMLRAAELVGGDFRICLAGTFDSPDLETKSQRDSSWEYVDFRGWVSRQEVASILSSSRMGLVLFHPAPNHMESLPTKLFEYMSAGLPVIASDIPLWRSIIAPEDCGILVNPLDPQDIARGVRHLLDSPAEAQQMGSRGRDAVLSRFSWESQVPNLIGLYDRLLS